jgi:serine carboxypeptidase-like clade 4
MTGGPGCSSELAIFFENGPYTVTKKFLQPPELHPNPFSWNNKATVIYIDQVTL